MCRLYGFHSEINSGVHRSLVAAENALAAQSQHHRDGWGMAYYVGNVPHLIRNEKQALEDSLFRDVSALVSTRTFIAHIRRATVGKVKILNCHPFQHAAWAFAHNGELARFGKDPVIGKAVRDLVDQRLRGHILGDTDSEVGFFVFLSFLAKRVDDIYSEKVSAADILSALRDTIQSIRKLCDAENHTSALTCLFTNGHTMVGYRFNRELFYSTHKTRCPERDTCYAFEENRCEKEVLDGVVKHVVLASEKLGGPNVWKELPQDHYVCVDRKMNFSTGNLGT